MNISQTNESELRNYGVNAVHLIKTNNYSELANLFGYALSFGKDPASAIESEIESILLQAGTNAQIAIESDPLIEVKYLKKNSTNLFAVVEVTLMLENAKGSILVELIVGKNGTQSHIYLEQIS